MNDSRARFEVFCRHCGAPENASHTIATLRGQLNTPEIEDFARGVVLEAAHQRQRWGSAHDRSKSAENWFWLVGYLAGKALRACIDGNREKALHHTISTAACLANWHQAIRSDPTGCGLGHDDDLKLSSESSE
jgi:hypothetical protein